MRHSSPWSSYGRMDAQPDSHGQMQQGDPTLGAAANVARGREALSRYLQHTYQEYRDIRAGRSGYQRLVADALKPSPRPESIEERLRRVGDE